MFKSIENVKQFISSYSDVKKSSQKTNGRAYVHLTRDSKDPELFTVRIETNAYDGGKAGAVLKHKYETIQAALKNEGYRICATKPFGPIREIDAGLFVYQKEMTFCPKEF